MSAHGAWPALAPLAGAAGVFAGAATVAPTPLAALGGSAVLVGAHFLTPWPERLGAARQAWAHRGGRIPNRKTYAPQSTPEGTFEIGAYLGGEPARWEPWGQGEEHLTAWGITGGGKSVFMRDLIATARLNWDWEVWVGDGKGGNEFRWAVDLGARLEDAEPVEVKVPVLTPTGRQKTKDGKPVYEATKTTGMIQMLEQAVAQVKERNAALRDFPVARPAPDGTMRQVWPTSLRQLTPEERERFGYRPVLIVIDDVAAELRVGETKAALIAAIDYLLSKARSVGIHVVLAIQRGGVEVINSFAGSLLGAKVLLGSTSDVTTRMLFGAGEKETIEVLAGDHGITLDPMEAATRGPGRAVLAGMDGRPASLAQLHEFDPILFAPLVPEGSVTTPTASSPPRDPDSPSASGDASAEPDRAGGVADPEPAPLTGAPVGRADATPSPSRVSACIGKAYARESVLTSAAPPDAPPDTRAGGAGPGPALPPAGPARRWLAGAVGRARLRVGSWRWLASTRRPNRTPRIKAKREDVLRRSGGRCGGCRRDLALDDAWDVEHIRPRMLGGSDEMANLRAVCPECHRGIKTPADWKAWRTRAKLIRRVRSASVGPAWAFSLALAGYGFWCRLTDSGPPPLIVGVVLLVLIWLRYFSRAMRGKGVDGMNTLDRQLEDRAYRGSLGIAATWEKHASLARARVVYVGMGATSLWLLGFYLPSLPGLIG